MDQSEQNGNLMLQKGVLLVEALLQEAITRQRRLWQKYSEGKKPEEWWITDQEADLLLAVQNSESSKQVKKGKVLGIGKRTRARTRFSM